MVVKERAVVCVSLLLLVCQVRGHHIPGEMNRTINNLLEHYNASQEDEKAQFSGKPVFPREPLNGKIEWKMVYMNIVLERYEELLGKMLNQTDVTSGNSISVSDREVREKLTYVLERIQELRRHQYQEQEKVLQKLKGLNDIQMDSAAVQRKALWELPWLYEEASSLSNHHRVQMQQRRRRQIQRAKARRAA